MKLSVQQLMHFIKAADKIAEFINEHRPADDASPADKNKYQVIVAAGTSIANMANHLSSAEVNVKG